jgi:hypothetical protein
VTFTATVSVLGLGGLLITPTGQVQWHNTNNATTTYLGSTPLPTCLLTVIPCKVSITRVLPVGVNTVKANYVGDSLAATSAAQTNVTVLAPPTPPAPPTNLVATSGVDQVSLTWNASSGATSYEVYRSTDSGQLGSLIATVPSTNHVDSTVAPVSGPPLPTYFYRVVAINGAGSSGPSNQASANPVPPSATTETCAAGQQCVSDVAGSPDASTTIKTTSAASAGSQTVTQQVGTAALECTNVAGFAGVPADFHTTAPDAEKVADYTAYGAAGTVAFNFYAMQAVLDQAEVLSEAWAVA